MTVDEKTSAVVRGVALIVLDFVIYFAVFTAAAKLFVLLMGPVVGFLVSWAVAASVTGPIADGLYWVRTGKTHPSLRDRILK